MNTIKMISEIKLTCANLESEKKELVAKVKEIEDRLTAYHMAIDSLELTLANTAAPQAEPDANTVKKTKVGKQVYLEFNGETKSLSDWAKDLGVTTCAINHRLSQGWTVEQALTTPKSINQSNKKKSTPKAKKVFAYDAHDNVIRQYVGVGEAARDLNLPKTTVEKIIAKMSKDDQLRVRNYYLAYVA